MTIWNIRDVPNGSSVFLINSGKANSPFVVNWGIFKVCLSEYGMLYDVRKSLIFWDIIFLFLNLSEISVWFYLLFLGWVVSSFNCLWFQVKCYRMSCGLNEFERYAVNLVSTIYQVSFITLKWSLRFFEYLLDKKWNGVIKDYDIISLYMLCKL